MSVPSVSFQAPSASFPTIPSDTQVYELFDRIYTQPSGQDKAAFNSYVWKTEPSKLTVMLSNYIAGKRSWGIQAFDRLERVRDFMMPHAFTQNISKLQTAFRQLETSFVAARAINSEETEISEEEECEMLRNFIQRGTQHLDEGIADVRRGFEEIASQVERCVEMDRSQTVQLENLAAQVREIRQADEAAKIRKTQDAKLWRGRLFKAAAMIALCIVGVGAVIGLPFLLLLIL